MQRAIINWYKKNKRDLPWRKTTPWGVLLSEYMLQQTPVSRVLPIWSEWIKRWPTPRHLSKAKRSDVIKAWGSLGYPTRALRLHQAATTIAIEYKNKVPIIIKLPSNVKYVFYHPEYPVWFYNSLIKNYPNIKFSLETELKSIILFKLRTTIFTISRNFTKLNVRSCVV